MNEKNHWFKITKKSIIAILIYYGILLIVSLCFVYSLLVSTSEISGDKDILMHSLYAVSTFSILGCSIFYIRKLYKSCINLDVSIPETELDNIRHIGILMYFLLRPLFSIVFGILLLLAIKAGISVMTDENKLSNGFIYSMMFFAFFTGYSSGDIVDILETTGKKIVDKFFDKQNVSI